MVYPVQFSFWFIFFQLIFSNLILPFCLKEERKFNPSLTLCSGPVKKLISLIFSFDDEKLQYKGIVRELADLSVVTKYFLWGQYMCPLIFVLFLKSIRIFSERPIDFSKTMEVFNNYIIVYVAQIEKNIHLLIIIEHSLYLSLLLPQFHTFA